jgi:hypothetical protein
MDPLSITTGCLGLLAAVGKATLAITEFVRGCREARSDLAAITVELSQLNLVLELLKDDTAVSDDRVLPESLQAQILSIIANCSAVIDKINTALGKHGGKAGAAKWVTFGKTEVAGLNMSLEAHRASLNLVLELVSVSLSKAIKEDTSTIRTNVQEIKQDTSQIPQIMEELTRLRALVAAGENLPATGGDNYVLQQYLDSLTSYAETVCSDVEWESDGSVHSASRPPSPVGKAGISERPENQLSGSAVPANPNNVDAVSFHPTSPAAASQVAERGAPDVLSVADEPSFQPARGSPAEEPSKPDAGKWDGRTLPNPAARGTSLRSPVPQETTVVPAPFPSHRPFTSFISSQVGQGRVSGPVEEPPGDFDPFRFTIKAQTPAFDGAKIQLLSNVTNPKTDSEVHAEVTQRSSRWPSVLFGKS